jgi:excisionase family DNA binding protein
MSPIIEIEEICALLQCTPETVQEMLRAGDLPGVKPGKTWRVPRDAFLQRLNEMASDEAAARRAPKRPSYGPAPQPGPRRRPLIENALGY